jgi:hypothetical protein
MTGWEKAEGKGKIFLKTAEKATGSVLESRRARPAPRIILF